MILGRRGEVGQSREHLARLGICCTEVTVYGAATSKTDVQHRVSLLQPGPGFGFFSVAALNRRKQGNFYDSSTM